MKDFIVQISCTEVYEVKANNVGQAEEFISESTSEFSMFGGETIDIQAEEKE